MKKTGRFLAAFLSAMLFLLSFTTVYAMDYSLIEEVSELASASGEPEAAVSKDAANEDTGSEPSESGESSESEPSSETVSEEEAPDTSPSSGETSSEELSREEPSSEPEPEIPAVTRPLLEIQMYAGNRTDGSQVIGQTGGLGTISKTAVPVGNSADRTYEVTLVAGESELSTVSINPTTGEAVYA